MGSRDTGVVSNVSNATVKRGKTQGLTTEFSNKTTSGECRRVDHDRSGFKGKREKRIEESK